ncbi:MAG: prolyl oligopeptidase family serine peptidase [bacterium]
MKLAISAPLLATAMLSGCAHDQPIRTMAKPPETQSIPKRETIHGVKITDDYRWLEPLEKDSPEVEAWTTAQNGYTREVLNAMPCREDLARALEPWMSLDAIGAPTMTDAGYFHSERSGTQNQSVVRFRATVDGPSRTLLDVNTLDEKGLTGLDWWRPNEQGTLMAFGTSQKGSEMSELRILDVATGKWLPDMIAGKVGFSGWMPDGKSFFYSALSDATDPYSRETRHHLVGRLSAQDPVVVKQTNPSQIPSAGPSTDGKWLVGTLSRGWQANDLWIAPMGPWLEKGELRKTVIAEGLDARFDPVDVIDGVLYMTTTSNSPRGSLVAVDLAKPAWERCWRTLLAERPDMVLEGVSRAKDVFVTSWSKDVCSRFEVMDFEGKILGEIPLPGLGTAGISTDHRRHEAFVTYTSYDAPRTIYQTHVLHPKMRVWAETTVPGDLSKYMVEQVRATSKDGTKVPMFIVRRKDITRDGTNPTLLYGYGGFNVSLTPTFNPSIVPWLDAGGVYVVANLRGGGEYGEDWHRAGMRGSKQNVFDDFYACAEWLIAERYTSPAHLAIEGGSNGGLLTGVASTQRPDLFAAAIVGVPLLDMIRFQHFLIAKYWTPEYGSSENAEEFQWLYAYSPYHNVKAGTQYPALLVTAGENDSRVHPLHARKFVARVQERAANDVAAKPIMLWVDRDAGHGQGKPLAKRIEDEVDQWSFIMWQTGCCR